ncbi:MAG: glycosyltransferase family 61 protein [Bradyrhizobiaceae bacterium]|nr:MAG: glycosyltransferase family 61 protein [Bradyrhizobiaceae bacterium]
MFNKIEDQPDYIFRKLHPAQPSEAAPPLLHYSDRADEIYSEHVKEPKSFELGMAFAKDLIISGRSVARDRRAPLLLGPLMPEYVDSFASKNLIGQEHGIKGKNPRYVPGLSALVSHFNIGVYGHWLMESVPKLLLLAMHAGELPPFRIILHESAPQFASEWIRLILPDAHIELYDSSTEYVLCEQVVIPSCLAIKGYFFHPITNDLIDRLVKMHFVKSDPRFLYLTRESQSGYREMSNRQEIENAACASGLELVSPEVLSIPDQINLFANAKLIVSEFGSISHNSIFSPPHTHVFCLNWINMVQSRIAQLRRQTVGYQLPRSGLAVKYEPDITEKRFYQIDKERFKMNLDCLLESAG